MKADLIGRAAWFGMGLALTVLLGCTTPASPTPVSTSSVTSLPSVVPTHERPYFPIPDGYQCDQEIILEWPVIDEVLPRPAIPGAQIEIAGHGGAIRCGNAYNESSRDFDVYLDDEPVGTINCFVNHCEGSLDIPSDLESGTYSLRIGPNQEFALQVD